ncbi:SDR family oxidoreductase [Nonomuraea thailandensis]
MSEVLVIGATGTTGSRVAAFLRERGVPVRTAGRGQGTHVRFDWAERATHAPALRGVSAVYLVAPAGVADPVPLVEPFLEEAVRQGVRRVVQLSSSAVPEGAAGLGEVHRLVRTAMPEWAVLRPSWFMQNFTGRTSRCASGTGICCPRPGTPVWRSWTRRTSPPSPATR